MKATITGERYPPQQVEAKWQKIWEQRGLNRTNLAAAKKPYYNLMMFPYPSAEGLHVGNMYAFTAADIFGRFKRMQGFDVFEPIGLDGFGIHSENYALKIGRHPREHARLTEKNFYHQLRQIGAMYDWSRTVETYNPDYYRWTQWLFVQLFKAGLAYRAQAPVNFCPACKTVLSDEQVIAGACERCGRAVVKKELEQWFFKITACAGRLLSHLDKLDWPEKIKATQRNWIGRKDGVQIRFGDIEVFTTRPDTIFGVTFVVLSPGHKWAGKVKTVINPANGEEIPVFVGDYVMQEVGTGAIMGVPAHDQRDLDFAQKHGLPLVEVVSPTGQTQGVLRTSYEDLGILLNSEKYSGMKSEEAAEKIVADLGPQAKKVVTYHLRDWLVSRQRYWGAPIPMSNCPKCGWQPVPEGQLPVLLPDIADYRPEGHGKGPLARHPEFYETTCPKCGGKAQRETDVCDTFLDSAWYYLRYPSVGSPSVGNLPFDPELTEKWLPVDMYTGGAEHAVLHLLYARFVTMVLHDLGFLSFEEPFSRFFAHGLLIKDGAKMSKSRGNVVNPDEYLAKYGADVLRLYLMFMGPVDLGGDFRDAGMEGMKHWVDRLWRMITDQLNAGRRRDDPAAERELAKLTAAVGKSLESRRYNAAIAKIMEFRNFVSDGKKKLSLGQIRKLLPVLAPLAPHLAEELWQRLQLSVIGSPLSEASQPVNRLTGQPGAENRKPKTDNWSVHQQPWPTYDQRWLQEKEVTVVVQVNGKLRGRLHVPPGTGETEVVALAKETARLETYLTGKVGRTVYVPDKLLNFVVKT